MSRRTASLGEFSKERMRLGALLYPPTGEQRPRTRGDCEGGPRPCPWVSCRHHLYLEVTPAGSLHLPRPELQPWELEESCALDVADQGGVVLEEVADLMGVCRERARQIEHAARAKVAAAGGGEP